MHCGARTRHVLLLLWFAAARDTFCSVAGAKDDPRARELMDAINAGYQLRLTNWNHAILNDTFSKYEFQTSLCGIASILLGHLQSKYFCSAHALGHL